MNRAKWIPLFVWAIIAAACLVLGVAEDSGAQAVSFGIKTGVPGQLLETDRYGIQALTRQYVVGPVIDVRLPLHFSLEAGVMYKQIDQQSSQVILVGISCLTCEDGPYTVDQRQNVSRVGRSWEYPVAIQYHFSAPARLRPYVEGGYSYNHLSGIFVPGGYLPYDPTAPLPQVIYVQHAAGMNRSGGLFGAGVEIKLPLIHLTPGFRYSRYEKVFVPEPDAFHEPNLPQTPSLISFQRHALDFLVGINLNSISRRTDKPKQ